MVRLGVCVPVTIICMGQLLTGRGSSVSTSALRLFHSSHVHSYVYSGDSLLILFDYRTKYIRDILTLSKNSQN